MTAIVDLKELEDELGCEGALYALNAVVCLRGLSDEQRVAVFHRFCTFCGSTDPDCYCMRDD